MFSKARVLTSLGIIFHSMVLSFCIKTNTVRGLGLDESRYLVAGLYHWRLGDFEPANDSPPLAPMIAALPLLPQDVRLPPEVREDGGILATGDARDKELWNSGIFASSGANHDWYRFFCVARMTGFLWWLLGAWVIGRWSVELYGIPAGILAIALWCVSPHVLAHEQQVTPWLPLAVIWAAATHAFRDYLRFPSWETALGSGFFLGLAQLVDFASLALLVIWPLLVLLYRLTRPGAMPPDDVTPRDRTIHAIIIVGLSVCVVNVGYGFSSSGATLGSLDFTSAVRERTTQVPGELVATRWPSNPFRGTWLGRVVCPVPAHYLLGIDRRLKERGRPAAWAVDAEWPVEMADSPLSAAGKRLPLGLWGMMLGSLILTAARRATSAAWAEEVALWLIVGAGLLLTIPAVGLLSVPAGILLTTPFGILIASKLACLWKDGRRVIGGGAALLSLCVIASGLHAIYVDQITPENRARLRRDLGKYGARLGFPPPEPTPAPVPSGATGLVYRKFVDSRGVAMNYALFVPRGYRGNRRYPLLLFLLGYGDRGTSGRQYTAIGLPFTLEYREIDFLVLCPQGHSGTWEPDGDDALRAMELLDAVEKEYAVDPNRVSLTGVSSGGTGVWQLAARYPDRWAAIVPVASSPGNPGIAPRIKHIPCWCFHNHYDGGSPVRRVRWMIEALREAGGSPRYTEYLDVNHGAWDRAYNLPELFDWLSRQRRR